MQLFTKTIDHFKPYWRSLLVALACSLIAGGFTIMPPILTGKLINVVIDQSALDMISWLIGGIIISFLGKVTFETLQEFVQVRIGLDVISDMQLRAFERLHKTPMSFFTVTPRGDMLYRLTHDVEAIQNLNNTVVPRFLQQVISSVIAFVTVFALYWPAAVAMLVTIAIYVYPSFKLGKKVRKLTARQREMTGDIYSHLQESIESTRLIRLFQTQQTEINEQETRLLEWKNFSIRAALIGKVNWRLGNLVNNGFPGVIMLLGGYSVWNGSLEVGTLVAVLGFIPVMFQPVKSLAENALTIQQAIPALERIYEYFDLPIEQDDHLPKLPPVAGEIAVHNVTFRYPNTERNVLNGVSLTIAPGEHIGIVGTSGGGKSTLIQLILGLYEPNLGQIEVDGHHLRDIDLNSWRQQIGVVSQETFLLNSTLKQNLLYAKPDATDEELTEAVAAADLASWIESLPDGYETIVGERGLKLSGGQRQRVALARAILRKPAVLIFDEATSSLDGETEEKVQASLEKLIPGRTTLTIAHRLVTVKNADRIVLMKDGVIAEAGSHESLLAAGGHYYELYTAQYRELEREGA